MHASLVLFIEEQHYDRHPNAEIDANEHDRREGVHRHRVYAVRSR